MATNNLLFYFFFFGPWLCFRFTLELHLLAPIHFRDQQAHAQGRSPVWILRYKKDREAVSTSPFVAPGNWEESREMRKTSCASLHTTCVAAAVRVPRHRRSHPGCGHRFWGTPALLLQVISPIVEKEAEDGSAAPPLALDDAGVTKLHSKNWAFGPFVIDGVLLVSPQLSLLSGRLA